MKIHTLLVALAVACTGDITTDKTSDTATTPGNCPNGYDGPITITGADVTCSGTTVRFEVQTQGLTGDGMVYSQETGNDPDGQWADNHTVVTYEFDVCGTYDHLEREIQDGSTLNDPLDDYARDVSSVFQCGDHYGDPNVMTYAFSVNDNAGNQADCFAFGDDVNGMKSDSYDIAGEDPDFSLADCTAGQAGL